MQFAGSHRQHAMEKIVLSFTGRLAPVGLLEFGGSQKSITEPMEGALEAPRLNPCARQQRVNNCPFDAVITTENVGFNQWNEFLIIVAPMIHQTNGILNGQP